MNKNERLISAIGEIDEKYLEEGKTKMKRTAPIVAAASFLVVLALSLYLFVPFAPVTSDLKAYRGSAYFPLIEEIEDYRLSFLQPTYKNNFEALSSSLGGLFDGGFKGGAGGSNMGGSAPSIGDNGAWAPDMNENGDYVEVTDNQVEGVIESDLFKMSDKYIFRLGFRSDVEYRTPLLRVYTVDKENSTLAAEYELPRFYGEFFKDYSEAEMFLSADANTVTVLKNYTDEKTGLSKLGIISLDVSNVNEISTKAMVSIDGKLNTSRMVDGRLLLVTEYFFNRTQVDYDDPATFVPTINSGDGEKPIEFEDIIFPEEIGNTRYSVVALLDCENLALLGANALLNFTNDVYISENNVFITREYTDKIPDQNKPNSYTQSNMSDVAVLNYSGERLEKKGVITMNGQAEDQYSFDEKDGYLRVVTTTLDRVITENGDTVGARAKQNASLYIFDLSDNSLAYSVEGFAIEGEEATAVRFEGDKLYVCTAVVINFTDPVYFFDLSDYESITFSDTGVIEGYSDHLIDLGDGFTLGIGRENWSYSKVEIYEQQGDKVVSVCEFKFFGEYSTEYKSYLVNRESNLFGFAVDYFESENQDSYTNNAYVLLQFNGYEIVPVIISLDNIGLQSSTVRAAYVAGYLYITTPIGFTVEKVN